MLKALLWICNYYGKAMGEAAFCAGLPLKGEMTATQGIEALARHGFKAGITDRVVPNQAYTTLPNAVLECLRYDSSVQMTMRTAREPAWRQ